MAEYQDAAAPAQVPDTVTTVRYRCEACGKGEMKVGDTVYTSAPPKYEHVCSACGSRVALDRTYPYARTTYRDAGSLEQSQDRLKMLGQALGQVLVAAGMIRADVDMTGPELLLAAEDYCRAPNAEFHATEIQVGRRVERDDGRFYIPLNRAAFRLNDARSLTVARVASDAFDSVDEAERFALAFAEAWNHTNRHYD
ncbi:hypothetical protein KABACHOK_01960 [Brevundimonas phage vB_BpoS-Kabachok]|uniref:Uncharacterized protein n=1 Tax=Brevundimonas phage vB_BpoS-Kabachok TaxID=2948600 RepID=A0A9E7MQK6_9CAUD|nr:hypothetical protein KABACHOK_01960 [Brevundimonas phage vB_BpoS-Kabachok]